MVTRIERLWKHEVLWRYVDALAPRGFGFLLNTFVILKFGAHAYALPAWIMSVMGVLLSLLPEPMGYVLVSGRPAGAQKLARVLVPWLYGKLILCFGLAVAAVQVAAAELLETVTPIEAVWDVVGALMFMAGEVLWSTCAVNSFAAGTLARWARLGIALRIVAAAASIFVARLPGGNIGQSMVAFSVPLVVASVANLGWPRRLPRSWRVGWGALGRYSLWTYLNAFLINAIAQVPIVWAGSSLAVTPQVVGQLSYALRVLNVIVQPLTILQSVLIRDFARSKSTRDTAFRRYMLLFRGAGGMAMVATLVLALMSVRIAQSGYELPVAIVFMGIGISIMTFFRYEFALLNGFREARFIYWQAFLPSTVVCLFLYGATYFYGSLATVSAASGCAYAVLAAFIYRAARLRIVALQESSR
jgi:hypothetical protein